MNFLARMFRPITQGGMRSSILTFYSGGVGAGILSLPKVITSFGVGAGFIAIFLAAFLSYLSFEILIQAAEHSKKNTFANIM